MDLHKLPPPLPIVHLRRQSLPIKMSEIPFEIQMEIILRIPDFKSVVQFRSVSKAWKSIIDSKEFVTGHTSRHIQQQPRHLLIRGKDFYDPQNEVKYISIVDDETFPHQNFNLFIPDFCKDATLVGSSHGLFCLYDDKRSTVVIWNPSIRKTTVVPCEPCSMIDVVFGICHNTLDPKIVKINRNANPSTRVQVFTLSLGAWRFSLSNTCPRKSIVLGRSRADVDGFIYLDACDTNNEGGLYFNLIMSFDLTSEEFTELYLPTTPLAFLYVSSLRESLGVFEFNNDTNTLNLNVWIMRGCGCTRSFERLYHINPSDASIEMTRGFRMSGAFIVEVENDQEDLTTLAAYEPESKNITEIWSDGRKGAFRVHSYMETLLLIGH